MHSGAESAAYRRLWQQCNALGTSTSGVCSTCAHAGTPKIVTLTDAPQMRILDFRLGSGAHVTVRHRCPTLRWEVGAPDHESPAPRFFEAGSVITVDNISASTELREIVFELRLVSWSRCPTIL